MAGDEVHVWAPTSATSGLIEDGGVKLHPLPGGFGPRGLLAVSRQFARTACPRRVLLQYVPHAFGMRAMNIPFCAWIGSLRHTEVWIMFHEVWVAPEAGQSVRKAALVAATRAMATLLVARADRSFVSIPSWETRLQAIPFRRRQATWLPIPSNIPSEAPSESRSSVRTRLRLDPGTPLIGHFGTYGSLIAPLLMKAAIAILGEDPRRRLLLLGRRGDAFAAGLAGDPSIASRILAPGDLEASDVAAHLAACDVLVQPYVDGVSTRRTSVMAGLALGIPIATNNGPLTEPLWRESGAVELAATGNRVQEAAEILLRDPIRAVGLGARGQRLYRRRFSLDHTIRVLREQEDEATA
jgi:glycosyltransferase involved in cell wall biosynthesis